jgi:KDO2-lipid IV(A) lauroyltransferase
MRTRVERTQSDEDSQPRLSLQQQRNQAAENLRPRDRLLFYLMLAVLHATSLIPDFILLRVGAIGGRIAFKLDRRHVGIGLQNLEIAFPERSVAEREKILLASYINLGRSVADYIRLGGFFYKGILKRVRYDRLDYLLRLIEREKDHGLVALTAHFGAFELGPAVHTMNGFPLSLVHHTQGFLAADAVLTFIRERAGIDVVRKHSAARSVLKLLKSGRTVGVPFDQNAKRSEAVFVPFFGEPAATSSGLARLIMISRSAVFPAFAVRQGSSNRHVIEIKDEIPIQRSGNTEADIEENTRRFVKAVEDMVRQYPEQFLWTHRRYRTRPPGMAPIYENSGRRHRDLPA